MALRTRHGNESGDTGSLLLVGGTAPTTVTSPVNSGTNAWSMATGSVTSMVEFQYTPPALDLTHYFRAYFRFGSGPAALARIVEPLGPAGTGSVIPGTIRMNPDRTLRLFDRPGNFVGAVTSALAVDTWHYIEMGLLIPATGNGQIGMRLNGTQVVAMTVADVGNITFDRVRVGKSQATTITNMYVDDYGYNDSTGASNNSWVGAVGGGGGDTTPPETTIDSGPSGTVNVNTASFTFSANETATFEVRLDGGSWSTSTSPKAYSGLANGSHTFEVRAIDTALNVDPSPASRTWTVNVLSSLVTPSWNAPPTPANASTIKGTIQVDLLVDDNTKVKQVDFLWNGVLIQAVGNTQLLPPFDPFWDTTTEEDGTGTFTGRVTQNDNQVVNLTRTFTIDNSPVSSSDVKISLPNVFGDLEFVTKPILVKLGGTFVSKPIRVIGAALPPTAPLVVNWNSPAAGTILRGTASVSITPSDSSRVDSVLYERESDLLDLGTATTPPWSASFNSASLPNGAITIRATVTYDGTFTSIVKRDFVIDNSVAPPPVTTGIARWIPYGAWGVNDVHIRNTTARSTATVNFVPGSVGWVLCTRIVIDETFNLDKLWLNMKGGGTTWWRWDTTRFYAMGNGGILNTRMVLCTPTGQPRFVESFSNPSVIVAQELGLDPPTRYEQVISYIGGWPARSTAGGRDGPQPWYFNLRTTSGATPTIPADTMLAVCQWNSHPQSGSNFMSANLPRMRHLVFPPSFPGIINWPAQQKQSGRAMAANAVNTVDKNAPGAVSGLDPRECMMWSTNGGNTFPYVGMGVGTGYYGGAADPADNGPPMPIYMYQKVGSTTKYKGQPSYLSAAPNPGAFTLPPVTQAVRLTHAGGYWTAGGAAPATVTVSHRRGSSVIETATASGGSLSDTSGGIRMNTLSSPLDLAIGDYIVISSNVSPHIEYSDLNSKIFGLNQHTPMLFVLPWPWYTRGVGRVA